LIPQDKLNQLLDTTFRIKWLMNQHQKVGTSGDDHVFIEEIRKLAHEIINWCDDCAIKRW
jgi:hypothetical protein